MDLNIQNHLTNLRNYMDTFFGNIIYIKLKTVELTHFEALERAGVEKSWRSMFGKFGKRQAPENDEDPSNNFLQILHMGSGH